MLKNVEEVSLDDVTLSTSLVSDMQKKSAKISGAMALIQGCTVLGRIPITCVKSSRSFLWSDTPLHKVERLADNKVDFTIQQVL